MAIILPWGWPLQPVQQEIPDSSYPCYSLCVLQERFEHLGFFPSSLLHYLFCLSGGPSLSLHPSDSHLSPLNLSPLCWLRFVWQLVLKVSGPVNSVSAGRRHFLLCCRVVQSWPAYGSELSGTQTAFFFAWLTVTKLSAKVYKEKLNKIVISNELWHRLWDLQVYACAMWHTYAHWYSLQWQFRGSAMAQVHDF